LLFQLLLKAIRAPARTAFFAIFEAHWWQRHAPTVLHICGSEAFKNLATLRALRVGEWFVHLFRIIKVMPGLP
jgi:hypothetical protein